MKERAVGFVCAGWPPDVGGVESHAQDLARELAPRGWRARPLCLSYEEGRDPYSTATERAGDVEVTRMAYRYHDHGALADVVRNRRAEEVVGAWLDATRPDVVHVHHLTGFGLGVLEVLDARGVPTVMTLHDYWPLCPRGQMLHVDGGVCATPDPERCAACVGATWAHLMPSQGARAEDPRGAELDGDAAAADARTSYALEMLARPDRLLTPSAAARDVYARAGLDPRRVEVCPNGVEASDLAAEVAAARAPREDGSVRLGVLGTALPSKGVLELAEAFAAADAPGLTLEVHGNLPSYHGDETYLERLRALEAAHAGLTVHGPYARTELAGILAGLDGVAAPSRWAEVFGLTVREARAAGLPVLVSDAGDLPGVAADGQAGVVVGADDREGWVEALRRFAADAEARARWAAHPTTPRTAADMAAQVARAYARARWRRRWRRLTHRTRQARSAE